jgi:hypothetical protein
VFKVKVQPKLRISPETACSRITGVRPISQTAAPEVAPQAQEYVVGVRGHAWRACSP